MLISYASYFVSYILNNLKNVENIERVVLYGSVARNEAGKESDVDIFIEVKKKSLKLEKEIKDTEKKFYQGRESALFKAREVDNKFNIKIGNLKEWKDLYRAIASTGIVLYGPYEAKELPSGVKHQIIIYWDNIGKNRGAFLNKVYGFKVNNKKYSGLLEKFDGKRIGKSCIIFPIEYKNEVFSLLKEYKVEAKVMEVFG